MSVSKQPGTADSPQYQHTLKLTTIDLIGGIKCPICHIISSNKKDYDSHYVNHNTGNPNIVYMCVACNKEIIGYPTFRNHCYSSHVIKDRLTCEYCSKRFSKTSVLQQHIDNMHKFKCVHCKKQFPSKKEIQMHQITHLGDNPPYKCQSCGQQIDSADTCEQHIDDHCTLTYSCPICNEVIPDKSETVDHLVKHFGEIDEPLPESIVELTSESSIDLLGGILCVYCDTTHKTRVELELHFAEYHIEKDVIYSCNICGKQYDKYPQFGNHCYYHYSKDKFECDDCDKSFPRLSLLVQHAEAFHSGPASSRALACAHCHNTYASVKRLRTHLREVHGAECVECPEKGCGKMFDNPKDLIYHQAVHKTGHRCQHCLLQFTSLAACERHISMHCKKQYSCPVCTRSYAEKYLVMKHISQHFSSVLHLCKVCGKIFNAKHRLVEHSKVHSDSRNYKCTYCDKTFTKTNHLKQHLHIHTGLKPYQCNLCPKTFGSYPNYHKHVRRVHNVIKVNKPRKQITEVNIVNEKEKVKPKVLKNEPRNNNNVIEEDLVDSTSSELDAYAFVEESDDSMVQSDGINPLAMEHESNIFEAVVKGEYANLDTTLNNVPEFTEILPENNHDAFVAAVTPSFPPGAAPAALPPAEYGPDFGKDVTGFIDLDDQLPHIDPLLTIKNQPVLPYEPCPQPPPYAKWEPLISKVYAAPYGYDADAAILSVINTDIY